MATNRKKRSRHLREVLSKEQLEYLRTGDYGIDPETYLWARPRSPEVRSAFEAICGDYPPGTFPWAEKEFRGKR